MKKQVKVCDLREEGDDEHIAVRICDLCGKDACTAHAFLVLLSLGQFPSVRAGGAQGPEVFICTNCGKDGLRDNYALVKKVPNDPA